MKACVNFHDTLKQPDSRHFQPCVEEIPSCLHPPIQRIPPFWQLPVTALPEQSAAIPDGLSSTEAALRLTRFGPSIIHGERKRALILQILATFKNPLVIILLAAGELVPCDGRVPEAKVFSLDQATLTGEAFPVEKSPPDCPKSRPFAFVGTR